MPKSAAGGGEPAPPLTRLKWIFGADKGQEGGWVGGRGEPTTVPPNVNSNLVYLPSPREEGGNLLWIERSLN